MSSTAYQAFTTAPDNSLTYTATVTSSGNPVTEGELQFYDNGSAIGSAVAVNGSGQAQYIDDFGSGSPEGSQVIKAVYTDSGSSYGTSNGSVNVFVDNHTTGTSPQFCDAGGVTFNAQGVTTPYPQHVFVTGVSGSIAGITLTLKNITSSYGLTDWKILLVGPDGKAFVPTAFAGGYASPSGLATLTLSDAGTAYLQPGASNTVPSASTVYLPTDFGSYTFPSPAPATGYNVPYSQGSATFLSTFGSENLNSSTQSGQEWSLYISNTSGDTGTMAGGYCLTFQTNNFTATNTVLNISPTPATTGQALALQATVTANGTPISGGSVKSRNPGIRHHWEPRPPTATATLL